MGVCLGMPLKRKRAKQRPRRGKRRGRVMLLGVLRFTPTIQPDEAQKAAAEKEQRGGFGDGGRFIIY